MTVSCGGGDKAPLPSIEGGNSVKGKEKCEAGKTRSCSETIKRKSGVLTCFDGTQTCDDDGRWGSCESGKVSQRADPFTVDHSKFFKRFSLSAPTDCSTTNPCDPECQIFEEPGPIDTGFDPGAMVNWSEGPTPTWTPPNCGVTDLCAVSTSPLDPTCDPCVQSICANPATDHCCTDGATPTSWDQECVNAVYLICGDGTLPGPPNGGFCDWGALSDGPIRFGNGGLSGTRIGSTAPATDEVLLETSATNCSYKDIITTARVNLRNNCSINGDIVSAADVWLEASGGGTTEVSGIVYSGGDIDLRNGVQVSGGAVSVGNIDMAASTTTWIQGDVWTGATLTMGNGSSITGNVDSRGNITGQTGSNITGTVTLNTGSNATGVAIGDGPYMGTIAVPPVPTLYVPEVSDLDRDLSSECALASAKTNVIHNVPSDLVLEPGIYSDLLVTGAGADIVLKPGNYVFESLDIMNDADIRFDLGGVALADAKWDIATCNEFVMDGTNSFTIDGVGGQPASDRLIIYSDSTLNTQWIYKESAIFIGSGTSLDATFIAPHGRIYLGSSVTVDGFMWGGHIYTETNTTFNQDGAPPCELSDLWGASCDGFTIYDDTSSSYMVGSQVAFEGLVYECSDATNCNSGGGFDGGSGYWPGKGADWMAAWTVVTGCLTPVLPDPSGGGSGPVECPVDLGSSAGELWSSPCATGRDCQVDHRCENVYTDPSCGHSKCEEGEFMALGCDPCVDLMCDPDGDGSTTDPCCSDAGTGTEWDASCVARVESECDVTCGYNDGCEHDLCAVGGGITTTGCHSCVAEVCAARPSCCTEDGVGSTDEWDATCVDLVHASCGTQGESICEFSVFGASNVATSDGCNVSGGSLGGDINGLYLQYGCTVEDVYADSQIVMYDSLAGEVYSSGAITELGSTTTNSSNESVALNLPTLPTSTFACGAAAADDQNFGTADGTQSLSAGTYRDVAVFDDGGVGADNAIELDAGTYNIDTLELGNDTKLILPATGTVELNICSNLIVGRNVVFEGASGGLTTADALRIRVTQNGNSDLIIGEGSTVFGVFAAPDARIRVSGSGAMSATTVRGMLWADEVQLGDLVSVLSDGAAGAACHNAGLGEAPPATCPVTTPLTMALDESGNCAENLAEVDPYCSGVDLTLGSACAESIPICNRGASDFNGSVDLSFWPETSKQMATESPNLTDRLGTCSFSGSIAAGDCVTHDCSSTGLLNQTMTVMVNAPDSMGNHDVTECSVLDNWTVFTTGETCSDVCLAPPCSASLTPEVIVEDYEAECPDDMAPRWVTLGWDVTRTGDAEVTFEGVATQPGANTDYTLLSTASLDGDVCVWNDDGCAVDIAQALGLNSNNHPDTIFLRITLTPDGTDGATLNDWDVTYSCQYDE